MNNGKLRVLEWGQGYGKFSSLHSCLLCRLSFHAGLPLSLTLSPSLSSLFLYILFLLLSVYFFYITSVSLSPLLPDLSLSLSWLPMCLCYGHTGSSCFILLKDQYGAAHLTGPGGFWVAGCTC